MYAKREKSLAKVKSADSGNDTGYIRCVSLYKIKQKKKKQKKKENNSANTRTIRIDGIDDRYQ